MTLNQLSSIETEEMQIFYVFSLEAVFGRTGHQSPVKVLPCIMYIMDLSIFQTGLIYHHL